MSEKIYIVDDDPDDRFLICAALSGIAAEVDIIEAYDGIHLFDLIDQANSLPVALILLDVNMPRMNGLETLEKIKLIPALSSIPIVMFSTSDDASLAKQAYQSGVSAYFTKPSSFEGFIRLANAIKSKFL